ncbi:SMI1/KNR4 family protein [Streptomyces mirabilis]|nr:SMI1/KNR4 family protein [Streptomyces mirabilis]
MPETAGALSVVAGRIADMTDLMDDWRSFLVRWSQEWADAQNPDAPASERHVRDEEPVRTRWLGFPPASEERIRALEERLGHRLPPSYRTFLAVSDGWRHAGGFVWLLAGTDAVRRHEDAAGLAEYFPGDPDDDPTPEDVLLAGMWERALQLDVESDAVYVLLDPGDVDDAGEWAVYCYASWRASPPERYASFGAFMEAMYREFHSLQVSRSKSAGAEFVNATTRALDASVEAARLDALGGRYERASASLAEAIAYGRPRATGLRDQIRRLLGRRTRCLSRGSRPTRCTRRSFWPCWRPRTCGITRTARRRPATWRAPPTRCARRRTRSCDRWGRHLPPHRRRRFGRAVEEARELARWGDGTRPGTPARRTARLAADRPEHLAPVGLCADPLLGLDHPGARPELLATPRAGQRGDTGSTADLDPPGLAWLAEGDPGNFLTSYRFVLVESVEPAELPGRIGAPGDAVLNCADDLVGLGTRFPATPP